MTTSLNIDFALPMHHVAKWLNQKKISVYIHDCASKKDSQYEFNISIWPFYDGVPIYLPTYLPMYMKYLAIGLRDCLCLESHKIYMP